MKRIALTSPGDYGLAIVRSWLAKDVEPIVLINGTSKDIRSLCASTLDGRPIAYTNNPHDLEKAELVVASRATGGIEKDKATLPPGIPALSIAKGICPDGHTPSQILDANERPQIVVLSGPSIAKDMLERRGEFYVALAGPEKLRQHVEQFFDQGRVKFYKTEDRIGTEMLGAMKNIGAIANGIVSEWMERSGRLQPTLQRLEDLVLDDMRHLLRLVKSQENPREHPGGLLDYHVTCLKGRNAKMGRIIARAAKEGSDVRQAMEQSHVVAEGVESLPGFSRMLQQHAEKPFLTPWVQGIVSGETSVKAAKSAIVRKLFKNNIA